MQTRTKQNISFSLGTDNTLLDLEEEGEESECVRERERERRKERKKERDEGMSFEG